MNQAVIRASLTATKWRMHFLLGVCCLASLSQRALANGSDYSRTSQNAQAQGSPAKFPDVVFAIGDFDGDRRPDLATVEIARFNSFHSHYWVSFQLSTGRPQRIGVTGPSGGLVLLARDVNGDRTLDLVLVTAWRHELVAVLLNDGAGNFAAADPSQFRIDAASPSAGIGIAPSRIEDCTVLAVPYSLPGDLGRKTLAPPGQKAEPAFSRSFDFATTLCRSFFFGRAPPSSVL